MSLTHSKVSTIPNTDPTKVGGDDWNADHKLSGGTHGDVLVRDTTADNGMSLTARPSLSGLSAREEVFTAVATSPDLDCHQGYTTDGTYHYVIDTGTIYKRDASWNLVATNATPFSGLTGVTHLGDGQYYNGKLYIVAENYGGCGFVSNQRILTYDAATLARLSATDISAQNHEAAGLCIIPTDGANGIIYIVSFCDGTKLWKYDLSTFAFLGTLTLTSGQVTSAQGIAYGNGHFYISQNDAVTVAVSHTGEIYGPVLVADHGTTSTAHEGIDFYNGLLSRLTDDGTTQVVTSYALSTTEATVESQPGLLRMPHGGLIRTGKGYGATPSYSFVDDPRTGPYLNATGDMRIAASGADICAIYTGGLRIHQTQPISWGSSGLTSGDTSLQRSAAKVLAQGADNSFKTGLNTTANRPSAVTVGKGSQFYDTTLNKPIWSDGTNWRDAAGSVV